MNRMQRLHGSTAVLPATRTLFHKNRVTLDDIENYLAKEGQTGTVHLYNFNKEYRGRPARMFVLSSGVSTRQVGEKGHAHHDQTFANFGDYVIEDVFVLDDDGKFVGKERFTGAENLSVYK